MLYDTRMLFCLAVIIDAYEQEVGGVLGHLSGVLLTLDLVDSRVGIFSELQLDDDGGRFDVLARDEHDVGKAFSTCQLTMHHVVVAGVIVGEAQDAS